MNDSRFNKIIKDLEPYKNTSLLKFNLTPTGPIPITKKRTKLNIKSPSSITENPFNYISLTEESTPKILKNIEKLNHYDREDFIKSENELKKLKMITSNIDKNNKGLKGANLRYI